MRAMGGLGCLGGRGTGMRGESGGGGKKGSLLEMRAGDSWGALETDSG